MKLRFLAVGALALVASVVAPALVGAGPVATSVVAVLANGAYVDTGPMESGGEVANLVEDLEAGGHTVREFDDISPAGLTAALDGADVLAIPELENSEEGGAGPRGNLVDDLGEEGIAVIQAFVSDGGRILFFGDTEPDTVINSLFGFSVLTAWNSCDREDGDPENGEPCVLTAAAAATEFADAPATITYVNGTTGLYVSSLPAGSTVIYQITVEEGEGGDPVDVAGLATMPYGDGMVVFYGWDWYPDSFGDLEPVGVAEEAAWATVLDLGVSQPTVTATGGTGQVTFTSDSPSTQPVFVEYTFGGTTAVAEIAPGSTSAVVGLTGSGGLSFSVPGWGVGEGSVEVLAATAAPEPTAPVPAGPAQPVPAAPSFTG